MALLLGQSTSRRFWRSAYYADRAPQGAISLPEGFPCCYREADILVAAPWWAKQDGKIHVLAFDRKLWRSTAKTAVHVVGHVPDSSFHAFGDGVYITSPAFEFLQVASQRDIREAVAFGDELCGFYSFDRAAPRGFRSRAVPLATKRELERYLADARGCRGHRRALRALRYVVEGSASPMETVVEMLNCLPLALGGYALDAPLMNQPVQLSASAARIAKRRYCVADMCYPKAMLDIEYHGRFDHDNPDAFDSDRARVNALVEMGFEVIELTRAQVSDLARYEEIVRHFAKRTGKVLRREALGAIPARLEARRLLFGWNNMYGEPGDQL